MNIRELVASTGATERQVRYLISEGFVPPPRGGRANADYGDDHLEAIKRYNRLRDLGFPPAAIKLLLQSEAGVPFPVGQGITLVVSPDVLGSRADVKPILSQLETILDKILQGGGND